MDPTHRKDSRDRGTNDGVRSYNDGPREGTDSDDCVHDVIGDVVALFLFLLGVFGNVRIES